jgi:hypothetical protein
MCSFMPTLTPLVKAFVIMLSRLLKTLMQCLNQNLQLSTNLHTFVESHEIFARP